MSIKKQFKLKQGFTLLELLVVISIIGILIALGIVAFSTAQQKSRDAKRRGDMKAIQDGMEQYYATNGGEYDSHTTCATAFAESDIFPAGAPRDPKPAKNYIFDCGSTTDYCICAELETGGGNSANTDCGSLSETDGLYYCVTNLQ